jgi:hypothetical protein
MTMLTFCSGILFQTNAIEDLEEGKESVQYTSARIADRKEGGWGMGSGAKYDKGTLNETYRMQFCVYMHQHICQGVPIP